MNERKPRLGITACLCLVGLFGCSGPLVAKSEFAHSRFDQDTWPQKCQQLKQTLAKEPGINLTYQPQLETVTIPSSWQLHWFGRQVPIPAIEYADVVVMQGKSDYVLLLTGKGDYENTKVLLGKFPNFEPMVNIFAALSVSGKDTAQTSPEGIALTNQLFGGPVDSGELFDLGYRHTLDDLTCSHKDWQQEVPIAISLMMKEISTPVGTPKVAYDMKPGILTLSREQAGDKWWSRWQDDNYYADMLLHLPKGHEHGALGLAMARGDWPIAKDTPQWLTQLEIAIADPNRSNWQALATALKAAEMSEKSVQQVQKLIDNASK